MEEQWRTAIYNGEIYKNYEVSNLGRVRNLNYRDTGRIKELKQYEDRDSYLRVTLSKNKKRKPLLVHRLVACTFIPNPHNKPTVNHINENKHDNGIDNLEWATHREQVYHGTRTERASKKVRCIETGQVFKSTRQASEETGENIYHFYQCYQNREKTAGGYHWQYYKDYLIEINDRNELLIA